MDTQRIRLLKFLREFALLARNFDGTPDAIRTFRHVVARIDPSVLRHFLPGQISRIVSSFGRMIDTSTKESSGICYADVYKDDFCFVNVFGFSRPGLRIPLHDHPSQFAAMKVFQGSVRIRSFSIVPDSEEDSSDIDSFSDSDRFVTTRYLGETILSSKPGQEHCAVLEPHRGNIHEVVSLEPHTYFCDFFIPRANDCNYYNSVPTDTLVSGELVHLRRVNCPRDFVCRHLNFVSFSKLEHIE